MSIMFNQICINEEMLYIYIYIYIHTYTHTHQSKVFGYPQKLLFLILKVLFLMKKFMHHNGFVYYTKYKSSQATLNTNLKKKKNFLYLWFIKMTPFGCYHCFRFLSLFPPSCMSTNRWPTSCIPDGIAWCCSMLW